MEEGENIRVVVRCRPLSSQELHAGNSSVVDIFPQDRSISLRPVLQQSTQQSRDFSFDAVFGVESTQSDIYTSCVESVVAGVLDGYNATIFAYGETGTGKTYTIQGTTKEEAGIMPRVFEQIFACIQTADMHTDYLVRVSYLELYNEEIRDLLDKDVSKSRLDLREAKDRGVYVKNLRTVMVETVDEMNKILKIGSKNRSVGETLMNKNSSRSHSLFTIVVEKSEGQEHVQIGKLHLVDLAGSERQSKTGSVGEQLKEATNINLSLSALGNVMNALIDRQKNGGHIPYRDSKLTRLLQDSLGGNTKTLMIANIGPADYNYEESLSTLRYANRAKNIKNKPRVNEEPKDAMIREFKIQIASLRDQLKSLEQDTYHYPQPSKESNMENNESMVRGRGESVEQKVADPVRGVAIVAGVKETNLALERNEDLLEQRRVEMEKVAEKKRDLEQHLKEMERKLLSGEKYGGMVEMATAREHELQKRLDKLTKQEVNTVKKGAKIAKLEQKSQIADEKCLPLAKEVEKQTLKLKVTMEKYKTMSERVDELYHEHLVENGRLLEEIRLLQQQLDLKSVIVEAFVPERHQMKVQLRLKKKDIASQQNLPQRPRSAFGDRRPMSAFAKFAIAASDHNIRFKSENLLWLSVELPQD